MTARNIRSVQKEDRGVKKKSPNESVKSYLCNGKGLLAKNPDSQVDRLRKTEKEREKPTCRSVLCKKRGGVKIVPAAERETVSETWAPT